MSAFDSILALPRHIRHRLLMLADGILVGVALWGAMSLRLGTPYSPQSTIEISIFLGTIFVSFFVFHRLGVYRQITRYMDIKADLRIFNAITITTLCLGTIVALTRPELFPRSAFALFWVFALILVIGLRRLVKVMLERLSAIGRLEAANADEVLIYGAGISGHKLATELKRIGSHRPAYFIDDDESLWGQKVGSLKVRSPSDIADVVQNSNIKEIFLAMPSISKRRSREIVLSLEQHSLLVKTVPSVAEILSGDVSITNMRAIDAGDLLCRAPVPPRVDMLQKAMKGRTILVTGAGGSIGSQIVRQLLELELGPASIILFDLSESSLYEIDLQARDILSARNHKAESQKTSEPPCQIVTYLGSVLDGELLRRVIKKHNVSSIYHAAAYKHVPLVELNPIAGLHNNTIGTNVVAKVAREENVERFVLISTDKAVRPTNIMGASKRLAELVVQGNAEHPDCKTIFSIVRFGNVLASSGSVVKLFQKQIENGGPLTVTHPEVTRFFMSIEEAAQLVIQASNIASGGDLFLLEMGEPVKIDNLARIMIRLAGFTIDEDNTGSGDIAIEYTGLRPGEKLYEELIIDSNAEETEHSRIKRCNEPAISYDQMCEEISDLKKALGDSDLVTIKSMLVRLVEGYQQGPGKAKTEAA